MMMTRKLIDDGVKLGSHRTVAAVAWRDARAARATRPPASSSPLLLQHVPHPPYRANPHWSRAAMPGLLDAGMNRPVVLALIRRKSATLSASRAIPACRATTPPRIAGTSCLWHRGLPPPPAIRLREYLNL